jgi:(+)-trans-carveol dehydrogenase/(-)-trans-carveol dehydrogenase
MQVTETPRRGRLDGQTAFITGIARGQGRAHALRLAAEGARIIGTDGCVPMPTVAEYALPGVDDLRETERLVTANGGQILALQADVRVQHELDDALSQGIAEFGGVDVVVANAGIYTMGRVHELSEASFRETLDINMLGVWRTCKAAIPRLIEQGRGGSIILTSSVAALAVYQNSAHYTSSKHGVIGLAQVMAAELGPHRIRVNAVAPGTVNTPMIQSESTYRLFCPGKEHPTREDAAAVMQRLNALPEPWVEPEDVSNAVLWLASDEARFVTGATIPIDAGFRVA